jgi:hypothetical protein
VSLLLKAADASAAKLVLDKASPEAFAGLSDFGLHIGRSHMEQARSMDVVSESDRFGVFAGWTNFLGGSRSSENRADYRLSNNSAMLGVRYKVGGGLTADIFATQGSGTVRTDFMNADLDGQTFGLGGTYAGGDELPITLNANIVGGMFTGKGTRQTNTGTSRFTGADSSLVQGAVSAAYRVLSRQASVLSLDLGFNLAGSSVDEFSETGASGENLRVHSQYNTSAIAEFGVSGGFRLSPHARLSGRVAAEHNFSSVERDVTANVVGEPTAFTVRGNGMGKTRLSTGVGARYDFTKAFSLGADFKGTFGGDQRAGTALFLNAAYNF